jgi:iron-sulfur cluster repair protein YtfE (RIC family)
MREINKDMTINDVIKMHPASVKVFAKYQLDSCCGGFQELDVAAQLYGVDLEKLMDELRESMKEGN